ncbi:sensor histidine kinase [Thauera sinica]|uniref:Sensor histidine kinase n=1 Tax=Thauera sinica TaxID=2665146 RepID=A0ABW1AQX7_9RHOO|nr:histidine kinase [Thauera sp. K11]ATE59020.1 sensor histidine kinase [Thauera sp. K11]
MESIKQKAVPLSAPGLPDFRNLGVMLRLLLAVNLLALVTVLLRVDDPALVVPELVLTGGRLELPLLLAALVLYLAAPRLARLGTQGGRAAVFVIAALAVVASFPLLEGASDVGAVALARRLAWAMGATAACLFYFDYRNRRYSPALTEARLLALTARIRPHFLFNSLNGVLGVIRSEPRRAERALEELADLFRALMQDNRDLVALGDEVALCERYVDLERLRLGERLTVRWELDDGADEGTAGSGAGSARPLLMHALVPPLLLQPLLENAVYHGIEPASEAGEVVVRIAHRGGELRIEVDNPVCDGVRHQTGNRMALDNIRERLMLFFDLEAALDIDAGNERYRVCIRLPYRSART